MRIEDLASADMIGRLVGFDTTSRNSNLPLVDWVRDYLDGHGVESRLTYDETRQKANLFATLGPADEAGVILSGHTDVVPVDGQPWTMEPFAVTPKDGRLYGRGTCDMKSFDAVCLALVPEFLAAGLRRPVHLALSYDEEVGCTGVRGMIADLGHLAVAPSACIVGEPTEMVPVIAHKGKYSYRCVVRGRECHSSLAPQGVNAVELAAELVAKLRGLARRKREEGPFDDGFDIPHSTVHVGRIEGGTAVNIVPRECWFDFEVRHLPGDDALALIAEVQRYAEEALLPEMRAVDPEAGFAWHRMSHIPGLDTGPDDAVTALATALSGANATGKVAFGTEGGLFQGAGVPTIVCGPGSIAQAHKPDEFIAVEQVARCEQFMRRLMDRAAQ